MKIAVIGLGYVGLPLAVALSRKHEVVGFDVSVRRLAELRQGIDSTEEVGDQELLNVELQLTSDPNAIGDCQVIIVTVPTPIDREKQPDFGPLITACELIGPVLQKSAIIVFESTVYPGATEEVCAPALERASGLKSGVDFKLGYSPERINPGDKAHPIQKIVKVVAAQDPETLETLASIYGSIVEEGVFRATSIKVAEAAKVIENTQRDINIALMNEVSKICDLLGIRSGDVLEAAGTKWNFLKFHPGLVGGHCIGVDPFYLTAKAEALGYHPEVILAGRRVNDSMGPYVGQRVLTMLAEAGHPVSDARVGMLGFTFKENVSDIRNSKAIDTYGVLQDAGISPIVHDPRADPKSMRELYGIDLSPLSDFSDLDAVICVVRHDQYREIDHRISEMLVNDGIVVDVGSLVDAATLRPDVRYWSL